MYRLSLVTVLAALSLTAIVTPNCCSADIGNPAEEELAADLALLQGRWEMKHGRAGDLSPTTHSIKTIDGNKKTIQRFDITSGKLIGERTADFVLGKSGSLRTYTFSSACGALSEGTTHVYKIEEETLIEVTGLLQHSVDGDARKLPAGFAVSRWKRAVQPAGVAEEADKDLAADLALLQGSWTMDHGNQGQGPPDTHSVRTIEGNKETLQRFDITTGKLKSEHRVEFALSKSGNARVFTFYPEGESPEDGGSYVYKLDGNSFIEVTGLLHGDAYTNYQPRFGVYRWKRVEDGDNKPATPKE